MPADRFRDKLYPIGIVPAKVLKYGHWLPEEDEQLHSLVEMFGPKNWEKLAVYHSTRNGKQMRERWLSYAKNGAVNKGPFTAKETAIICYLHLKKRVGWAHIAKALNTGRPPNTCKNHYHNYISKRARDPAFVERCAQIYDREVVWPSLSSKEKMAIENLICRFTN